MNKGVFDALVIGAGPAGSIAAAILQNAGHRVLVIERELFPRFSIGESLLPQCMEYIEEAGMLNAVNSAGFQRKNGAIFQHRGTYSGFDFNEQFSTGWGETFEVQRADFDKLLADEAERAGVDIRYKHETINIDIEQEHPSVTCKLSDGSYETYTGKFLLDASGFGRVLPRMLNLESPSDFPIRTSLFTHIQDNISDCSYDRDKILITVHPEKRDVWYWLIPFANGRSSVGVVAEPSLLTNYDSGVDRNLRAIVAEDPALNGLLANADWDTPARQITGYSTNVTQLCSSKYALLGNAGEFLDPVFSSGVTIAMRSASIAAGLLHRQLRGEAVDWDEEYAKPLSKGVNTFRTFVSAWYNGRFQDVIFHKKKSPEIRRMICSILAGYAWDETNPYVSSPERRLNTLWQYCKPSD
jgi:flavin-dependent dehydrogenase